MTSHEFAKLLLEKPDLELFALDILGPQKCGRPKVYVITEDDADMNRSCADHVGDEVIGFYI